MFPHKGTSGYVPVNKQSGGYVPDRDFANRHEE